MLIHFNYLEQPFKGLPKVVLQLMSVLCFCVAVQFHLTKTKEKQAFGFLITITSRICMECSRKSMVSTKS